MKDFLIAAFLVASGVAWVELRDWLPWIAKRIIFQAVSAVPTEVRERMQEELAAELAAIPGRISPLAFALSVWWGFWRTAIFERLNISASQRAVRVVDIALSNIMVILMAPVLLLAMLATYLNGRGPTLLSIRCVGRNNKEFALLRFRTIDPKIGDHSPTGLFMRKTRIDRLPELLNVIRGEMSLVGPLPSKQRASDYSLMDLRPGLIWFPTGSTYDADSYGKSTSKTMLTYFHLLYAGFVVMLFYEAE